ncbi:hypothetical protein [Halovenus sp. HT40]|uniref:hypothetical protein n=1 Tax=Halovenus sp. HT40 TaxID=3126691 RepID=UPI00300F12E1
MADDDIRLWLVERSYGHDEDLVTLIFATTDGEKQLKKQLSHNMLYGKTITAAREEKPENLDEVKDEETRGRYASEASRMAEKHDPDDEV